MVLSKMFYSIDFIEHDLYKQLNKYYALYMMEAKSEKKWANHANH